VSPDPPLEPRYAWRGRSGPSLVALVGGEPARLDPDGVSAAFGEIEPTAATCIEGATRLPSWYAPGLRSAPARPLRASLERACERLPAKGIALALSGGVDSAVLCALLRDRAVAYTLAPSIAGYSEEDAALAVARRLGARVRSVHVRADDFVDALPEAVAACGAPLYNLHPVGRYLLARAARADGVEILVSGDGADEIFRGTSGGDYLPIVGALTRAAGLRPEAPYLDPEVAPFVAEDPDKRVLRALALTLGVPDEIARGAKRPRLAPPMDLDRYRDDALVAALGRCLGRAPSRDTDRERTSWTSLAILARAFEGLELRCAA
jgi:asparagine synthase (glutamine-hydrolysing)